MAITQWFSLLAAGMPHLAWTTLLILHLLWALVTGCFTRICAFTIWLLHPGEKAVSSPEDYILTSGDPPLGELEGLSREARAVCS